MMRRIVANMKPTASDDRVTKAAIQRLQTAYELDGDPVNPLDVVTNVKEAAAEHQLQATERQVQAMNAYIDSLPEPQRTIFEMRRDGVDKEEIARRMGLGVKPVCKSLAKTFSNLRMITQ